MNIFGLFFSFLIPGIVIGMLISAVISESGKKAGRTAKRVANIENASARTNNKLFVYSMAEDIKPSAKLKLIKGEESRKKLYICSVGSNKAA